LASLLELPDISTLLRNAKLEEITKKHEEWSIENNLIMNPSIEHSAGKKGNDL
jgi:hypothetical protein